MHTLTEASDRMLSRNRLVPGLLVALSLLGLAGAAGATSTGAYYELSVQNSQTGNTYVPATWVTSSTGQPVSTGLQTIAGRANVEASAAPGALRAQVWGDAVVRSIALTGVSDASSTHAAAQFIDEITILSSNPALAGTTATVHASLVVTGSMLASYLLQQAIQPFNQMATWQVYEYMEYA